ncbi:MAG: extracellular solute-binding protein, partial [Alphaproteobacteria bacterium]|nr:extracellular solute-binding protein [Alphaproteobacteria bacterium]
MNDLVSKYGDGINDNQKITINGDIMAIAFMANAQHLIYRADILKKVGADVPTSYEEMLKVAKKIRKQGILEYPISGAYQAGWNLAQEFINMYIGHGAEFYKAGTAEVSINNKQGVATLKMLKALTEYMNPDYLTHDSNAAAAEWEAGNVALMNFWGSRTGVLMDSEGSAPQVYQNTAVSGPLTVGKSGVPATTLWWDGWTVAKNLSDADAKATFLAMKHGISSGLLNEETMGQAVWLIDGYKPAPVNEGVFKTIKAGAKPYPMLPHHGLLHTALGNNIADYLQGKESAKQTLKDIEAEYTAAAKEKGFLK